MSDVNNNSTTKSQQYWLERSDADIAAVGEIEVLTPTGSNNPHQKYKLFPYLLFYFLKKNKKETRRCLKEI
jgi:hypothetical protein